MDTNQAIEHGRRWLAAGWQWKRGQIGLAQDDDGEWRSILVTGISSSGRPNCYGVSLPATAVPDPRDAGTRGHMLEQVREAWVDKHLHVVPWKCGRPVNPEFTHKYGFYLCRLGGAPLDRARVGYSEAEALIAAREAAP